MTALKPVSVSARRAASLSSVVRVTTPFSPGALSGHSLDIDVVISHYAADIRNDPHLFAMMMIRFIQRSSSGLLPANFA